MQGTQDIQVEANKHYESRFDEEMRSLISIVDDYDSEKYEDALQQLEEMPLSFEKVATYWRDEETEWEILLGTGGPADRVQVRTDMSGRVLSAVYQYQDWFQPWTTADGQDSELVQRFAEIVGYYED